MFSWICPKCGREVPPSYTECPDCSPAKPAEATTVTAPQPPPPGPPAAAEVRIPEPRVLATAPPPAVTEPVPTRSTSPWLIMLLAAVGIVVLLGALYLYVLPKKPVTANTPAAADQAAQTNQQPAAAPAKAAHPYAKFLEVTGLRVNEDAKQRAQVQFIVVNHSAADLPEMKMQITVRSGGKPIFDFPYTLPSLGPFETKEGSTALKTDLKPYELPDWQFLKADFDITSTPD